MKRIKSILILAGLMTLVVVARGSDVGTLTTFTPSTTISSSAVNANFSALATAVNTKQDKENTPLIAGVANCGVTGCVTTTAGGLLVVNVQSASITVPGPGTIRVSFNGTAECGTETTHVNASMNAQIVSTLTAAPVFSGDGATFIEAFPQPSPFQAYPLFMARLFTVNPGGSFPATFTFYANVQNDQLTSAACKIWGGNMDAQWFAN